MHRKLDVMFAEVCPQKVKNCQFIIGSDFSGLLEAIKIANYLGKNFVHLKSLIYNSTSQRDMWLIKQ